MVTIKVKDHIAHCVSNDDGAQLFIMIKRIVDRGEAVTVSFEGIYSIPTSFVNSAFIELLEHYHFDRIKKLLLFSNTTKQINEIIKKRFAFECSRHRSESCCA